MIMPFQGARWEGDCIPGVVPRADRYKASSLGLRCDDAGEIERLGCCEISILTHYHITYLFFCSYGSPPICPFLWLIRTPFVCRFKCVSENVSAEGGNK